MDASGWPPALRSRPISFRRSWRDFIAVVRRSELSSIQADDTTVVQLLLESRVDVALTEDPPEHESVEATAWRDDELVVVARLTMSFVARDSVAPGDLADFPFLVNEPRSPIRRAGERALSDLGVRLHRTMRVGGTEAIKQGVAAGLGLAIVSRAAATDLLELGRIAIVPVDGLMIRRKSLAAQAAAARRGYQSC